jgi:hypothetical protein
VPPLRGLGDVATAGKCRLLAQKKGGVGIFSRQLKFTLALLSTQYEVGNFQALLSFFQDY